MTPERWQQIQDVLEKALEMSPGERSAYLNRACSSDPSLRQEVETLLASSDGVRSSFLQSAPLRTPLTSGTKVGEYEVKSILGAGGMGEVYRARDARLGRDVAIKILPSALSADSERLRRFEQEARAAAALNHPNILAVHQMGTYEGAPYLVSELLEGETLREQIRRGRLPARKAIDYGVQIARGLAAAQEKGIVHRDLKPENLFVTKDGRVKILDFGLAKLVRPQSRSEHNSPSLAEGTEPGMVMGTVGYMAPEQVRGQIADHRADIFAFGAILYEMLTGKRAFDKLTSADTMSAILNEDPPGVSQMATNIPAALQRVVHRCLEKDREHRFQSASDLAFALDALSETSGSGSAWRTARAAKPRMRAPWIIVFATLVVLAGALGLWRKWGASKSGSARREIIRQQLTATSAEDPVMNAAMSHDGKYLAYTTPRSKKTHILEIDSGELRDLPAPDVPLPLAWFSDGSHLLAQRIGHPGLWKVSIWDGTYRRLFDGDVDAAAVSPDGLHVAFNTSSSEIWLIGSNGEDPHRILAAGELDSMVRSVSWSPHGQRLAYSHSRGAYDNKPDVTIETCDLDGNNRSLVLSDSRLWSPTGLSPLAWLADGRIVYSVGRDLFSDNKLIWTVGVDPDSGRRLGQPAPVPSSEKMPLLLQSSVDGKRLIYQSDRHRDGIYLADLRSGSTEPNVRPLMVDDWFNYPRDWTQDSKALIFESLRDAKRVILRKTIGTELGDVLVSGSENYRWPALSPNGERLLFTASPTADVADPSKRLMTMAKDGGARFPLLAGFYTYHCGHTPSSGCVVEEAEGQQLIFSVLDPEKGKGAEIQRLDTGPNRDWSLSPDGTRIAICDENWIRVVTIADHKVESLPHRGNWTDAERVTWAADSKHLFATAWSDHNSQAILSIDPSGKVDVLNEITAGSGWLEDLRASPDGHYLAFTKRIFERNVVMLENF